MRGNERIQRMNAIRGRLSMRQRGSMSAIWTAMTFIPMTWLRKQADILDADTAHRYVACEPQRLLLLGKHRQDTAHRKACPGVRADGQRDWSFFYIHTNAMMFRNVGLQGIDPSPAVCRSLTISLTYMSCLTAGSTICRTACSTTARSRTHLPPQRLSKLYLKRADALQQKDHTARAFRRGHWCLCTVHPAV